MTAPATQGLLRIALLTNPQDIKPSPKTTVQDIAASLSCRLNMWPPCVAAGHWAYSKRAKTNYSQLTSALHARNSSSLNTLYVVKSCCNLYHCWHVADIHSMNCHGSCVLLIAPNRGPSDLPACKNR